MRKTVLLAALGIVQMAGAVAHGQEVNADAMKNPEVIVTAQKYQAYEQAEVPNVSMPRRADFLLAHVNVICDTRDATQRDSELRTTLRAMIAGAGDRAGVSLVVAIDDIVLPFRESSFDQTIGPDDREDTSRAALIIKTPIRPDDTFETASGRIAAFVKSIEKTGRTQIVLDGSRDLTVVNPERYRPDLLQMIATDAKKTAATFGTAQGVEVDGVEHLIQWHKIGQLDLALYIPYHLKLVPLRSS